MRRRDFLGGLSASALLACGEPGMEPLPDPRLAAKLDLSNVCIRSDELGDEIEPAIAFAQQAALNQVEIRSVWGKYAFLWDGQTLQRLRDRLDEAGLRVALLDTPILRCAAPGPAPVEAAATAIEAEAARLDVPAREQYKRSEEFLDQAIAAAKILGTDKIGIFSLWRVAEPEAARELLLENWAELGAAAEGAEMRLCVENDPATNLADCRETAAALRLAPANVGMSWNVADAAAGGERPYPDGYELLDKKRILHCRVRGAGVGGEVPWPRIFKSLAEDEYSGAISVEANSGDGAERGEMVRRSLAGVVAALEQQIAPEQEPR